jgi:hypothetical protein
VRPDPRPGGRGGEQAPADGLYKPKKFDYLNFVLSSLTLGDYADGDQELFAAAVEEEQQGGCGAQSCIA